MNQTASRELMVVRRRVEAWRRRSGGRGSRMPEHLWKEAVAVAGVAGLCATAVALRLNYNRLKERARQSSDKSSDKTSQFVAVELPQLNGGTHLVVDLANREGEQMRMEVSGLSGMDLVSLAQTFLKRSSCSN